MLKGYYAPSDFKTPLLPYVTDEVLFTTLGLAEPEVELIRHPASEDCGAMDYIKIDLPYGSWAAGDITYDWPGEPDLLHLESLFA